RSRRRTVYTCDAFPVFYLSHQTPAPRVPPSFPTRRSSDLLGDRTGSPNEPPGQPGTRGRFAREPEGVFTPCADVNVRGTRSRAEDRKSTRLNSSHVKTSYAVFCLKKKNT